MSLREAYDGQASYGAQEAVETQTPAIDALQLAVLPPTIQAPTEKVGNTVDVAPASQGLAAPSVRVSLAQRLDQLLFWEECWRHIVLIIYRCLGNLPASISGLVCASSALYTWSYCARPGWEGFGICM